MPWQLQLLLPRAFPADLHIPVYAALAEKSNATDKDHAVLV